MPDPYPMTNYSKEDSRRSDTSLRVLPQNPDAEASVLAACLLSPDAIEEAATKLRPENFYRGANQIIFQAMLNLYIRHVPVDAISVAENLHGSGQLEIAGGKEYLADLMDSRYSMLNWNSHIEVVRRTAILRDLVRAATDINALAYDAPDDLNAVVEEAERILFNVTEKRIESGFQKIDSLLQETFEEITRLAESRSEMAGIPSGFKDVDDLFHGFRGGDLIILAARPAVGKTAFALNIAANAAKSGATVAFHSLEMNATQLVQRVLCSEAEVSLTEVRNGRLAKGGMQKIVEASSRLNDLEFYVDESPDISILELRAKVRRQMRDVKKGIIIVDYLQLMRPAVPRPNARQVEVAEISRGLKVLAKELNMPVIALSQLSRQLEYRKDKRPMLADLRESGSIEQDADIVMFLDRSTSTKEEEDPNRPDHGVAKLHVAKHRNGATKEINLAFIDSSTKFKDFFDESRIGGI